ncbi:NAD(P)H-hydrate dehydratase [Rhodoferax bucti]|uniref:NAD(P)H-hydrate dehydratase n=1 Tax=Rhodoferax bucti TaxID=2576305 RepID=UPI0011096DC7|nr:NAD(P)H-hydrate dehydratase [Rhodoferax bucti]
MNSEWITGPGGPRVGSRLPLFDTASTRLIEAQAAHHQPTGFLMQRAGLALAQLTLAVAPHAQLVWVACGRGNNGGDGLEAALHLHRWGKSVHVSLPEGGGALPSDAALALERASQAGLTIHSEPPVHWDACIDALLSIGLRDAPTSVYADWIGRIRAGQGPVISADIPSGLHADTGAVPGACIRASHTLALLGLKPGQFTAQGRDLCGDIWLNTLSADHVTPPPAWLNPAPEALARPHASHKGSYGDVAIVGGTGGMEGAAVLAARAALHAGAGRVYLALLASGHESPGVPRPADLMLRSTGSLRPETCTVVAGCGGGEEIADTLPRWLKESARLVLDADALNAIAISPTLQSLVQQRRADTTLITPHPLEAARLLGCSVADVQADRLAAAQRLATHLQCAVILKGSGSVIAAPRQTLHINPTGNGQLAVAGTGDVLAGMAGASLAHTASAWTAACTASYRHGVLADSWPADVALTATRLVDSIQK